MATKETSVMDELRDLTECSICNSMVSDPRVLPCIHTFCLECLENFESSWHKKPDDKMLCPVCRREFTIPPEGMNGLQKNFFVERLAELMKVSKPIGNVTGCDACKVNSDSTETEATEYCIQCREKLCSHCSMEHLGNKFNRSHQVVKMGCDVTEILAEKHYSSACDLHPEEKTKMYCVDCKVVICMMCFAESHNTHKCMDVRKAGEKFQEEIENYIRNLLEFPSETLDTKEQLEQEKKKFLKELQDTERMIKYKCKELKDMVDKHANELINELSSVEQKRFKVMDSRKEEIERHLESVDRFNTFSKEIISRGSPSDVCRAVDNLRMRAEELQKLHDIHIRQKRPSASVFFNEMKLRGLLPANNIIGNIEEKEEKERLFTIWKENTLKFLAKSVKRRKVVTWSAILVIILAIAVFWCPSNKVNHVTRLETSCAHVLSAAFSKSAINILCSDPKRILIYEDQSPFKLQKLILLHWVIEPMGMVASPASDYLYVADSGNDCIWMISRNGTLFYKTKWKNNGDLKLQSLSQDGSKILATDKNFLEFKLYSTELGIMSYSFELPENIYPTQHAVETSMGDFVFSYGWRKSDSKGICRVGRDGYIMQCYKPINESQELNYPIHLSLTSDDQVIVADTLNDRVLLLNSDLSWNRVILTGDDDDGIIKPKILSYENEKKLLLVANFEGNVHLYNSNITYL